MEFRHETWNDAEVRDCLSSREVALCAAEVEIDDNAIVHTAPFAYLRLRKEPPYTDAEIDSARALVGTAHRQVGDVYLYAKHDNDGVAPAHVKRIAG